MKRFVLKLKLKNWRDKKSLERAGFTLVEMLVVIGVTSVLTSIFVTQSGLLRDQVVIFREEAQMIQTLFKAKTSSIQVLADEEGVSACGYGVYFENVGRSQNGKYTIYSRNRNNDGTCPINSQVRYGNANQITKISEHELDSRIYLRNDSDRDFVFIPPYPDIYIDGGANQDGTVFLCLKEQISFCRGVEVNKVGQITVRR